jgi:hypothetical protein
MIKITQLSQTIQNILTVEAERAARESGFVQRNSKLTGALFVQTLVFGFWHNPQASREQLVQTAAHLGVRLSAQALDKRLHERGADCLKRVLEAAINTQFSASPLMLPVLSRFSAVFVQDSSQITLPAQLANVWVGSGNQSTLDTGSSQLKLSLRLDLRTGSLMGPFLNNGTFSDQNTEIQHAPIPVGSLRIADLGYFNLPVFREIGKQQGYWLSRYLTKTAVMDHSGKRINLVELLRKKRSARFDMDILLGAEEKLPCRLMVERLPEAVAEQRHRRILAEAKDKGRTPSEEILTLSSWSIFVTNVPKEMVSVREALVLAKARWQIECVWKLWKSAGQIDQWRSAKSPAILCEVYAKLIAMLLQHWMLVSGCWHFPDRSITKASASIKQALYALVITYSSFRQFRSTLKKILTVLQEGCRINKSRVTPRTYQLFLAIIEKP